MGLGGPLPHAGPRQICGFAQPMTDMPATSEPAVVVEQLVKVYKTTRAVDGISFALEAGPSPGFSGATAPERPPPSP